MTCLLRMPLTYFFFQAEDGIRDLYVTGVQTCALPIWLILMMDRTFDERQNAIIVEKAIRYAPRGIVGIDIAGPRPGGKRYPYRELQPLIEEARGAGLGITIHVGEDRKSTRLNSSHVESSY